MNIASRRRCRRPLQRQNPLKLQRIKRWRHLARKHKSHTLPALQQPQILHTQRRTPKLPLDRRNRPPQSPRRHARIRQPLDRPQRHQIPEIVKAFAPTNPRPHQPQPFPIAQPPVIHPDDPPCLRPRISLAQVPPSRRWPARRARAPSQNFCARLSPGCQSLANRPVPLPKFVSAITRQGTRPDRKRRPC